MQATASLQKAPAELSEAELKQFDEQGYLVYRDFLTAEEVQEIKDAMQALCVTAVKGISDGSYKARRNGKPGHNMSGWWVGSTENNFGVQFERAVDNLEDLTPEELGTSYRTRIYPFSKHGLIETGKIRQ